MNELQKYRWELLLKLNGMFFPAEVAKKLRFAYKASVNASPEMSAALETFLNICADYHNYRILAVYDVEKAKAGKDNHRRELQEVVSRLDKSEDCQSVIDFLVMDEAIKLVAEIYKKTLFLCVDDAKKSGLVELSLFCDELLSGRRTEQCQLYVKKLLYALDNRTFSILMYEALSLIFINFEYVGKDETIVLYRILQKNDFFISRHAQKVRSALHL